MSTFQLNFFPFLLDFLKIFRSKTVQRGVADLIVTNGTIFTSDDSLPFAQSMAIRSGRIIQVGDYSSVQVKLQLFSVFSFRFLVLFPAVLNCFFFKLYLLISIEYSF